LMTLVPDDAIKGQLEAIVKEQRHETSKAKFSGKDHAPEGKDDLAMALVLAAYPPNYDEERDTEPHQRENTSGYEDVEPDVVEGSEQSGFKAMLSGGSASGEDTRPSTVNSESAFGISPDRGTSRRYSRRHSR
jgi:hypothetical protein